MIPNWLSYFTARLNYNTESGEENHANHGSIINIPTRWCPSSEWRSWGSHNSNFTWANMVDIPNYFIGLCSLTNIAGGTPCRWLSSCRGVPSPDHAQGGTLRDALLSFQSQESLSPLISWESAGNRENDIR